MDPLVDVAAVFAPGQAVYARVVEADQATGALALSMRGGAADIRADLESQLLRLRAALEAEDLQPGGAGGAGSAGEPGPPAPLPDAQDVSRFAALPASEWLEGVVHHRASFGAYVEVQAPGGPRVWGLAHLSELRPGNALAPGQRVRVRVVGADVGASRLALSLREADGESAN